MPKRARWIIYGRLDPSPTTIDEPGQLIFAGKRIEGFWLVEWMRRSPERRAHAVIEAQKRFSDGRWATDVTAVVPLSAAMARLPQRARQAERQGVHRGTESSVCANIPLPD